MRSLVGAGGPTTGQPTTSMICLLVQLLSFASFIKVGHASTAVYPTGYPTGQPTRQPTRAPTNVLTPPPTAVPTMLRITQGRAFYYTHHIGDSCNSHVYQYTITSPTAINTCTPSLSNEGVVAGQYLVECAQGDFKLTLFKKKFASNDVRCNGPQVEAVSKTTFKRCSSTDRVLGPSVTPHCGAVPSLNRPRLVIASSIMPSAEAPTSCSTPPSSSSSTASASSLPRSVGSEVLLLNVCGPVFAEGAEGGLSTVAASYRRLSRIESHPNDPLSILIQVQSFSPHDAKCSDNPTSTTTVRYSADTNAGCLADPLLTGRLYIGGAMVF